jgi:multisubunit Na+/H+ antiporter MnhG subunit
MDSRPAETRDSLGPAGWRHAARTGYEWLLAAFLVMGAAQIFLAGLGVFRLNDLQASSDTAFAPHRAVGFAMAGVALLILAAALIARCGTRVVSLAAVLFVLTSFVQSLLAGLADNTPVYGGLHALDGLAVLGIAALLYTSGRRRRS